MSGFINIIGFAILCAFLLYIFDEKLVMVLPIAIAILSGILFVLAGIRRLSWIDYIFLIEICLCIILLVIMNRKIKWERIKNNCFNGSTLAYLIMLILIVILVKYRIACAWDELGVWALETKTLYYIDGFTGIYKHTTIDYGDYLPGQMLMGWWTCHMDPTKFNDGLMYIGYYGLYATIIAIVFRRVKGILQGIVSGILGTFLILAIPSIVSIFEYWVLVVELQQSVAVGVLIYCLFEKADSRHNVNYICIRWWALCFILASLKNSSLIFIMFVYILGIALKMFDKKQTDIGLKYSRAYMQWPCWVIGLVLTFFYRKLWFYIVKRTCRAGFFATNVAGERAITGLRNIFIRDDWKEYIPSFLRAIYAEPLHMNHTIGMDLTVLGLMLCTIIGFYILYRKKIFLYGKKELWMVCSIYVIEICLYLIILFGMFAFVFMEEQYLDSEIMILGVSRYGEPLFLGFLIAIFIMLCADMHCGWREIIACFFFIIMTMNSGVVKLIDAGVFKPAEYINAQQEKWDSFREKNKNFRNEVESCFAPNEQHRILYVVSVEEMVNVRELRYDMAPRSIVIVPYEKKQNLCELIQGYNSTWKPEYVYFNSSIPNEAVELYYGEKVGDNDRLFKIIYIDDALCLEHKNPE